MRTWSWKHVPGRPGKIDMGPTARENALVYDDDGSTVVAFPCDSPAPLTKDQAALIAAAPRLANALDRLLTQSGAAIYAIAQLVDAEQAKDLILDGPVIAEARAALADAGWNE